MCREPHDVADFDHQSALLDGRGKRIGDLGVDERDRDVSSATAMNGIRTRMISASAHAEACALRTVRALLLLRPRRGRWHVALQPHIDDDIAVVLVIVRGIEHED